MMKVMVTGGTGAVGKEVVRRLIGHHYQITVLCRTPQVAAGDGATYVVGDITDYPSLQRAVQGCEAVVHLAAIPNPSAGSSEKVFLSNVQGTFNVFKACEEEGIHRVVQASSINALGIFYGKVEAPIHYLPVDEDHPCVSSDAYSFAKHVIEDIGDYYWRRSGISSVALRLPYVAPVAHHQINEGRKSKTRDLCDRLLKLDPNERLGWFEQD
jgi:UDP-glucose 4-epimerase